MALKTHPLVIHLNSLIHEEKWEQAWAVISEQWGRVEAVLRPYLYGGLAKMAPHLGYELNLNSYQEDLDDLLPRTSHLSAQFFHGINQRGLAHYELVLFGDLISHLVADSNQTLTRLGKLILSLPHGGVLADYGGGKGLFAYEAKKLRSDLSAYVVDLSSPEEIEAHEPNPAILAQALRKQVQFLKGDGLQTNLPANQQADLIFTVLVDLYVHNPLALLAKLYNQLKPGGVLLTTINPLIFDLSQPWGDRMKLSHRLANNLRSMGIEVEAFLQGHTLAMRRKDDRHLVLNAHFYGSTPSGKVGQKAGVRYTYYGTHSNKSPLQLVEARNKSRL